MASKFYPLRFREGNKLETWRIADVYRPIVKPSCRKQGLKLCKGACFDVKTDVNHCGNCRTVCSAGQTCEAGVCTSPPPPPQCTVGSQCGNPIDCGPGDAGCFCVTGTSGTTACAYDAGCSDCTQDSECTAEPGGLCEIGSCCPAGACFYQRDNCANPQATAKIFKNGGKSSFDP